MTTNGLMLIEPAPAAVQTPAPTDPQHSKRRFVHQLFTTIAPRYDWFNRLASLNMDRGWRRRAVAESGLAPGMDVLDVCTGTGDLALLCAQRTQGEGLIAGLDFTEPMLKAASRKQQEQPRHLGYPAGRVGSWARWGRGRDVAPPGRGGAPQADVHWLRGDAQALPFASGTFDRVFIGFSTRNLSDLKAGIEEMNRVLKPHGKLVILETGRPSNPLVLAGYLLFLATVARLIGLALTGRLWPFTYLARSVKGFLRPSEFVTLITACGLAASYLPLSGGLASLYLATKPAGNA